MYRFVFIGLLILGLVIGCKNTQPIINQCQTDTVTLVDTTTVTISDPDIIKALVECDSDRTVRWIESSLLEHKLDSLKSIGVQFVVKSKIVYKDKIRTVENVIIEKSKPEIIYKVHPISWAAFVLCFAFMICFIITFIYAYKFYKKLQYARSSPAETSSN